MGVNLTDAIFSQAQRTPDAIAVIDAERAVDYRTLCRAVCLAAQRFRAAGWKAGDTIGISLRGSPTLYLVSSLALARMGVTQVTLPASGPEPLRASPIQRLGITGLVSDHGTATGGLAAGTVNPGQEWLRPSRDAAVDDIREDGGERLCFIRETSGTTATPKLIGITHDVEGAHRRIVAAAFSHLPGERFLNLTGIRFFMARRRAFYCLSDGGTLVLPPEGAAPGEMLRWIDSCRAAFVSCVPMHVHQLLRGVETTSPRLPSVRVLLVGASALPVSAVQEARRRLSPNLHVAYGVGEAGTVAIATPAMLAEYPDTIGRALPGVDLEIVDDQDHPVPAGVPGHVRVRGPGVIPCYLGAAEPEQASRFRVGWFYPGDIAVRNAEGLLFHKGRSDEVMNFDGILVGPAEIESVLRQHPDVMDVAAFALPSPEHHEIPAAAIVSERAVNADQLAQYCAQRLGLRSPRLFIQVPAIPRNAMGKILRRQLTELATTALGKSSRA